MYEIFEKLCEERGITPYRFCKDTGINSSTISTWKKKGNKCSSKTAEAVCEYFGVTMDYLMGLEKVDSRFSGKEASPEKYEKLKKNIEKHHANTNLSDQTTEQIDLFTGKHKIMKMAEDIMNKEQLKEFNRRLNETLPDNLNPNQGTIAAHFDGNEYTKEELEEIKNFAEFVKSRRK